MMYEQAARFVCVQSENETKRCRATGDAARARLQMDLIDRNPAARR